jgi:RNA polymerase sigma-70 factor (ECF subfamily)
MERLLETTWPHAFRIARSIVADDAAAEDAAQEACASVITKLRTLRSCEAFRGWFYRLVVRQAMLELKKRPSAEVWEIVAADSTERYVTAIDVRAALDALPVKLRTVLILHHYADLNSKEIGTVLGLPSPTVRFHLAQARRALQKLLGGDEFDYGMQSAEALS